MAIKQIPEESYGVIESFIASLIFYLPDTFLLMPIVREKMLFWIIFYNFCILFLSMSFIINKIWGKKE